MPTETLKPDRIWADKIRFFCIDTDILQRHRFQFRSGALNHLPQQLPDSMELLLPEVVQSEVMKHRMDAVIKANSELMTATKNVHRASGISVSTIELAATSLNVVQRSQEEFSKELHEFVSRCNGRVLPFDDIDPAALFGDYFIQKPPFEERKKSEFPDAAALQLLQKYAEDHETMGIVVSADCGWEQFAAQSDRLFCIKSLEELTALFAATGRSADEVKSRITAMIEDPSSPIHMTIAHALRDHLNDAEWDASSFVPDVGDRAEVEVYAAALKSYRLDDDVDVWLDEDGDDSSWVMEITAHAIVTLEASGQMFKWDGIDREFVKLASESLSFDEEIDITIYLTLSEVRMDLSPDEWDVDVDIASAEYHLGWREVAFDLS